MVENNIVAVASVAAAVVGGTAVGIAAGIAAGSAAAAAAAAAAEEHSKDWRDSAGCVFAFRLFWCVL